MKKSSLIISFLLIACGSPKGADEPTQTSTPSVAANRPIERAGIELGKYTKVYRGREGIKVTIADLTGSDPVRALIRVEGVKHELDGLVLLYKVSTGQHGLKYSTTLRGQDVYTVLTQKYGGLEVWLPGAGEAQRVSFDEKETQKIEPEELVKAYREIELDGTIAKLQSLARDEREREQDAMLEATAERVDKACGGRITAEIKWTSVTDEELKGYSISGFCGDGMAAMEALCERNQDAKRALAQVKRFTCSFGGEFNISTKNNAVSYVVPATISNAKQKASRQLSMSLGVDRVVLKIGKGYLVVGVAGSHDPVYFGSGSTLYEQRLLRGASDSYKPLWSSKGPSVLKRNKGTWQLQCGQKKTELALVKGAARDKVLVAKMVGPRFKREPYILAHGDNGTYYYVDALAPEFAEKDKAYRLFVGVKGKVKQVSVADVVRFKGGQVFETRTGQFRAQVYRDGEGFADFGKEGKRERLITLPLSESVTLIYKDLGVYQGVDLRTACD